MVNRFSMQVVLALCVLKKQARVAISKMTSHQTGKQQQKQKFQPFEGNDKTQYRIKYSK